MNWTRATPLPDREGFASMFAGVHGGSLVAAGGANFPGKRPWEGGTKVWYDDVWVLDRPDGSWRKAGKLPRPLAYGVSISLAEGILCIGGSDAAGHSRDVFRLSLDRNGILIRQFPELPKPCANLCGALIGKTVYVAGGIESPSSTTAAQSFWSLDLEDVAKGWQELESWPGPGRMLATAGASDDTFFLFSGAALKAGADGKPVREWLKDAYRFKKEQGWKRLADLPNVSVAAPSPATPVSPGRLLVLGGDDGSQILTPPTDHKGFPRSIQIYDIRADRWSVGGTLPFSIVTAPAVQWNGSVTIISGEKQPGIRTPDAWMGKAN